MRKTHYRTKAPRGLLDPKPNLLWPHPIRQVIFDCDGTLLDTLDLYREADVIVSGHPKSEFVERGFWLRVNGFSEAMNARAVIEEFGLSMTEEEFIAQRAEVVTDLLRDAGVFLGGPRLVGSISRRGIPLAIATGSTHAMHAAKVEGRPDFFATFERTVTADDVAPDRGKPHPDIFLKASRFAPENVLVFGDATTDVLGANSAGMPIVFVAHGSEDVVRQMEEAGGKALLVLNELFEFDEAEFMWEEDGRAEGAAE